MMLRSAASPRVGTLVLALLSTLASNVGAQTPPPPPAPPQEYVPIGFVGRWRTENPAWSPQQRGGREFAFKDLLHEEYVEATGQFTGFVKYRYESGNFSANVNNSAVGAYLQTTCAMDANGNMVTKELFWRQREETAYAHVHCRYRTREPATRRVLAFVLFTSDPVYAVADLQARYAPGSCPDLAVAMADGIAWMPGVLPNVNDSWYDPKCIEDCLDFTCASTSRVASTDATASIYGLAIGIPVGVCLLGVAICSAVFWRLKRKRKQTPAASPSADRAAPE